MAKKKKGEQNSEQGEQKKGLKKLFSLKMLVLLLLILVLGVGSYFAYKYFLDKQKQNANNATAKDKSQEKKEKPTSMVTLPTVLVNLSDPLGKRYLKMTAKLKVQGKNAEKMIQEKMPQIKDSIIMLLSSKSYQDLSSMEKKIRLKKQIVSRINQALEKSVVNSVFFTQFVVQ